MMHDMWNNAPIVGIRPSKSAPCSPIKPILRTRSDSSHVAHKVPVGDTPYVKAKRMQLVEKDPEKAIALFWAAINAGDRVDSALKDMAIVMKQQNRAEEAVEAIKSLRSRCSDQAQESLDNILLDLYKRCGRLDDQIALLRHKLHLIHQGMAFNGKRTKTARSQGRKFQVSVEQEATRLLGNLGWALMQQENYVEAETAYRRALLIGPDNNKMCNLGICLMKQGRVAEARETLKQVRPAVAAGPTGVDSHLKAFERAQEMLRDLESKLLNRDRFDQSWPFELFFGSSSVWQPQPCGDSSRPQEHFADENVDANGLLTRPEFSSANSLNVAAPPFYSRSTTKDLNQIYQLQDPLGKLKRTRSGNGAMEKKPVVIAEELQKPAPMMAANEEEPKEQRNRRKSLSMDETGKAWLELLPDNNAFEEAIVAAVLAPVLEAAEAAEEVITSSSPALLQRKVGKRLKVFQDITLCLSPKA